nr:reverse transcriptase domain-containing protein [Tanacetum cinerariifolium]
MPPRMMTRSAGLPVVESRGGERVNGLVDVGGVEDLGEENIRNVLVNGNWVGCLYKEFLACNPNEYEEFCPSLEMQKLETELWNHAMVGAGHAAYINRFHELARLVPHLVTPKSWKIKRYVYGLAPQIHGMVAATEPTMILNVVLKVGVLIYEAIRNGSIKKNLRREEMRENLARIRM